MPRLLVPAALLVFAAGGCAGVPTSPAPAPPAAASGPVALDHAALHVADLDRAVAFYRGLFGVAEIATPGDPAVIRWLDLGGGAALHLIKYPGPVPPTTRAVHFALRVPDLDAVAARARERGVPTSDWPGVAGAVSVRGDGVRQIYVQDPDGYWIEVNDATSPGA